MTITPSDFTTNANQLVVGQLYLLHTPDYCESFYALAICENHEDGNIVFVDALMHIPISPSSIEGWIPIED